MTSVAHQSGAAAEPLSGTQWTIAADGHQAVVVEVGGGLRSYRANGVDHVSGYGDDELAAGCAGQILAPWPNRIRDGQYTFEGTQYQLFITEPERNNALHGLVNYARWHAVEQSADAVTLEYLMPAQPGYPWPLRLRTTWQVSAAGLRATHEVTNLAAQPVPFGFSVHPYLQIPGVPVDELTLTLPARNRLLVDSRLLPIGASKVAGTEFDYTEGRRIGAAVLDTAFGDVEHAADGTSTVVLAGGGAEVRIWGDDSFGWWQVFTSDTLSGDRYRKAVAIEPMTCPPDAFRSGRGLIVLDPGDAWRGVWGITPVPAS
ncbi:aldose 1-epimerase family protein [Catenuloplanes atrovinosus]|uniref:Aldose 1-epimerase n=1 Tax=Catenuloplanes atrovinosus TaxID=137266 RepID=A0AAE4CE17_9ACTN|nr:aldose 1-epimerase family protein [Catenuloplanes atrovinosus]MDR7279614.1 aldose 1-epimerase [Catenuloplanes atrovinosus]